MSGPPGGPLTGSGGSVGPVDGAAGVADLLARSRSTVVLTGAGISVPSGIPDFRSPGTGIWEDVDPMEVAHIDAWRRDPDRFWHFYGARFASLVDKRPNRAHGIVAELESRGAIDGVVTQNVDRLHRAAGTRRLVEIHGSIASSVCMACGERVALEQVIELLEQSAGAPGCPSCGEVLKPDVTLFGELLDSDAVEQAQQLARAADLMLCIGSSLVVHPVAGLPQATLDAGGQIVLITRGETPYDSSARVKLDGDVVEALEAVLAADSG